MRKSDNYGVSAHVGFDKVARKVSASPEALANLLAEIQFELKLEDDFEARFVSEWNSTGVVRSFNERTAKKLRRLADLVEGVAT